MNETKTARDGMKTQTSTIMSKFLFYILQQKKRKRRMKNENKYGICKRAYSIDKH